MILRQNESTYQNMGVHCAWKRVQMDYKEGEYLSEEQMDFLYFNGPVILQNDILRNNQVRLTKKITTYLFKEANNDLLCSFSTRKDLTKEQVLMLITKNDLHIKRKLANNPSIDMTNEIANKIIETNDREAIAGLLDNFELSPVIHTTLLVGNFMEEHNLIFPKRNKRNRKGGSVSKAVKDWLKKVP
jgi:hypothetical protein